MKDKIVLIFLSLFIFTSLIFADVRDGSILFLQPSVRAAAMQHAYTSNAVEDVFSAMSNPAFRASLPIVGIMYNTSFYDGKDLSDAAFGAFSFLYPELFYGVNVGAGAVSTAVGNLGGHQDIMAYLNLSKKIKFLSFGANVKYLYSKFYRDTDSSSVTGDFGLSAKYAFINIGIAGFNLFGDFYDTQGKRIDPYLTAGASADFNYKDISFIAALDAVQPEISRQRIIPRAGFETSYSFFALRFGYEYDDCSGKKDKYSAGFGIDFKNFKLDYAYIYDNEGYSRHGHRAALSYKLKRYMVKNEQFKNQVKLEKNQQKLKKKADKQEIKDKKEFEKKQKQLQVLRMKKEKEENRAKNKEMPFRSANYNASEQEFVAVLATDGAESSIAAPDAPQKKQVYPSSKTKKDDFDAAKYLLGLEKAEGSKSAADPAGMIVAKQHMHQPTPHDSHDYDPAQELLKKSNSSSTAQASKSSDDMPDFRIVRDDKPEKVKKFKSQQEVKKEQNAQSAKNSKEKNSKKSPYTDEVDEFDAARYILANPGAHKIKQYYVQPTKHSKDDYDPAMLLISQ